MRAYARRGPRLQPEPPARALLSRAWARSAPRAPAPASRSGPPAPGRAARPVGAVAGTGARRVWGQPAQRRAAASPTSAGADPAAAPPCGATRITIDAGSSAQTHHGACSVVVFTKWAPCAHRCRGSGPVSPVSAGRGRCGPRRPPQTGQVVPFLAASRPPPYPPVPLDEPRSCLSVFRIRCETIASC